MKTTAATQTFARGLFSLIAGGIGLFGAATAWSIPITITEGNPGNQGTDNVLYNDGSLQHTGTLIQGNFNGNGAGRIVDFTSSSGSQLLIGLGGQAEISGGSGNDPFTQLSFFLEDGYLFSKAILNVEAIANGNINFSVNYIDAVGTPFNQPFALSSSGNNFFGIQAADGARISSVNISTSDTQFNRLKQVRLGGFTPAQNVPDSGTTFTLLGVSLIGFELLRRALLTVRA